MVTKKKVKTKKPPTVQLRPDAKELLILDALKQLTGEKTYSGALMTAASQFKDQRDKINNLLAIGNQLQTKLNQTENVLHVLNSGNKMLESYAKKFTGKNFQKDLFDQ